jgi:hypothetical protein
MFESSRFQFLSAFLLVAMVLAFQPEAPSSLAFRRSTTVSSTTVFRVATRPPTDGKESSTASSSSSSPPPPAVEETTEKYGLEAGLFQSFRQKDGGESAKSLLKKYGIAYLATSIPLAAISFIICYILVDNGVDVGALLEKVGIESSGAADKAGTFAIAYAAHKAASPIRFPPTVILTPVVAKMIGKEPDEEKEEISP